MIWWFDLIWFWCFNAPFNNISALSWRPVLVEYPERTTDHGQATGKLYHLRLRVECTVFFVIYKAGREPTRIGDRIVWVVRSNDLTHWATRAPNLIWHARLKLHMHFILFCVLLSMVVIFSFLCIVLCIVVGAFCFDHSSVWPSSIYRFWLSLWYLQTFLKIIDAIANFETLKTPIR